MNPFTVIARRWRVILVFAVIVGVAGYAVSGQRNKEYTASSLVQVELSSEETGAYVDADTLQELTNVYLEVAESRRVYRSAALAIHAPYVGLAADVTVSVLEPGVLAFTAKTGSPATAASYANAVSNAFSAAVARTALAQRTERVGPLQAEVTRLEQTLSTLPANSSKASAVLSQLASLQSDIDTINGTPGNAADRISTATAPTGPSSPHPLKDALLAALLALIFAPAGVYLASNLRASYESPEQVSDDLGLPVLSVVPRSTGSDDEPTEAMRLIHIAMRHSARERGDAEASSQVVLFASATPGDGKTFVASRMLRTLTASGVPAVFIDGDLHKHDFSSTEVTDVAAGLVDLLQDPELLGELIPVLEGKRLPADEQPRVHFIASGGIEGVQGSSLIGSAALPAVMRRIVGIGLPVYIDSPAILPTSDGLVLARYATDVLLVIHANRTRRADAAEALRRLNSVGAPVRGVIFNAATRRTPYAYGGYYYGSYGAGRSTDGGTSKVAPRENESSA